MRERGTRKQDAFSPRRASRRGLHLFVCAGACLAALLVSCFKPSCCWNCVCCQEESLMSRLWRPCSTVRSALWIPASNLRNLHLGGWSCQWKKATWPITDSLLWFFPLQRLARAQWGFRRIRKQFHPSRPDRFPSLDHLWILGSDRASSLQMPARSSRWERGCRI